MEETTVFSFETLMLPAEFYGGVTEFTMKIIIAMICIMVLITVIARCTGRNLHVPIMWYVNVPKIIVCIIAILFTFCYDYTTKTVCAPNFENMLISTFLVGVLALIELLTCLASMVKDVCARFGIEFN